MRPLFAIPLAVFLVAVLLVPPARASDPWMFDPTFREGRGEDVLCEGPPPLHRLQLDAFIDLFEAAFALAMPAKTEQDLRDALEIEYGAADEATRGAFAALVAPRASLGLAARKGEVATVETGLGAFRRALDLRLRAAPAARSHAILRMLLARLRETPCPGTPPIRGPALDAWLELVEFVASLARNEDYEPTPGQTAALAGRLPLALHPEKAVVRARVRDVHRTWLRLKAVWDGADVARRTSLRWKALTVLAKALPPDRRITVGPPSDLAAYARAAVALARTQSSYEAWSNLARQPSVVFDVIDAWLGPPPQGTDHVLRFR